MLSVGALAMLLSACSSPTRTPSGPQPYVPDGSTPEVDGGGPDAEIIVGMYAYVGVFFDVDAPEPQTYLPRLWLTKDDLSAHCAEDPSTAASPWQNVLEIDGTTGDLPGFEAPVPGTISFTQGSAVGHNYTLSGSVDIQQLSITDPPTTYNGAYPQFTSTKATLLGAIAPDATTEAVFASVDWSPWGGFEAMRCPLLDGHPTE
jgi:hypothetical protein